VTYHPPGPPAGGQGPEGGSDPFGGTPFGSNPYGTGPYPGPPVYSNTAPARPPLPPANTLATLSLVFAVIFAPAGAVLGHLGLSQIARTHERGRDRALIGLALSYAVIVGAVIVLVVSAVGDSGGSTKTGHSVAAPPSGGSATAPTAANGPIPAPLLTVEEVSRVLANPLPGAPAPPALKDLTATSVFSTPLAAGAAGRVDPSDCESTRFAGTDKALGATGYRSLSGASMQGAGPYVPQVITEVVVTYPDSGAAQRAAESYIGQVDACSAVNHGKFRLTAPDGSPQGDWIGASAGAPMNLFGMSYRTIHSQRFDFGMNATHLPQGEFYTCMHVVTTKGASLIDVAVSGTGVFFQSIDLSRKIAAQIS
jgi:eukaryotic-like serine/threonine-protein kinase